MSQIHPHQFSIGHVKPHNLYITWLLLIIFTIYQTSLSARALMQLPRASSDLLILAPSLKRAPLFDVTVARSEPAKSINDILASRTSAWSPAVLSFCRTNTYNFGVRKEKRPLDKIPLFKTIENKIISTMKIATVPRLKNVKCLSLFIYLGMIID